MKKLKGRHYAYLVKNDWNKGKIRQKTKKYLGRVYFFQQKQEKGIDQEQKVRVLQQEKTKDSFKNILIELVKNEIIKHDLGREGVEFDEKSLKITKNKREIVLGINEGFLCQESLKKLLNYSPRQDADGVEFAKRIVNAGLKVEEDVFVMLFEIFGSAEGTEHEGREEGEAGNDGKKDMEIYY